MKAKVRKVLKGVVDDLATDVDEARAALKGDDEGEAVRRLTELWKSACFTEMDRDLLEAVVDRDPAEWVRVRLEDDRLAFDQVLKTPYTTFWKLDPSYFSLGNKFVVELLRCGFEVLYSKKYGGDYYFGYDDSRPYYSAMENYWIPLFKVLHGLE